MEQSWLNPDFAAGQLIAIAIIILGCLIVLPVVFGALIYSTLTLIGRVKEWQRSRGRDEAEQEE